MKNLKKNLISVGLGTGGAIAAKVVSNKLVPMIPRVGDKPIVKSLLPIALGVFLMDNKSAMLADLGFGMAVSGASDFAAKKVPGIGAIINDDMESVAAQVIEGLDEQVDEILNVSDDDMGDDDMGDDDMGDDDMGDDMSDDDMGDDDDN